MIDWTKPVETDEDEPRPVRVLCTDMGGSHPVAVSYIGNPPMLACYTECGQGWHADISARYLTPLRNVRPKPVKREGWVNVYPSNDIYGRLGEAGDIFPDQLAAKSAAVSGCAATVRIEWEEVPNDA